MRVLGTVVLALSLGCSRLSSETYEGGTPPADYFVIFECEYREVGKSEFELLNFSRLENLRAGTKRSTVSRLISNVPTYSCLNIDDSANDTQNSFFYGSLEIKISSSEIQNCDSENLTTSYSSDGEFVLAPFQYRTDESQHENRWLLYQAYSDFQVGRHRSAQETCEYLGTLMPEDVRGWRQMDE